MARKLSTAARRRQAYAATHAAGRSTMPWRGGRMAPLDPERIARDAASRRIATVDAAARAATARYSESRGAGQTVARAYAAAVDAHDAASVLYLNGHTGGYIIDADALDRVTSKPLTNVTNADGSPVTRGITLPDDVTAVVTLSYDDGRTPGEDGEDCYSADDVAAWRENEWTFQTVTVTLTDDDGRELSYATCGCVEVGDYWPGTEESQVWHVVPDLVSEAWDEVREQREADAAAEELAISDAAASRDALNALRDALEASEKLTPDDAGYHLSEAVSTYLATLEA